MLTSHQVQILKRYKRVMGVPKELRTPEDQNIIDVYNELGNALLTSHDVQFTKLETEKPANVKPVMLVDVDVQELEITKGKVKHAQNKKN